MARWFEQHLDDAVRDNREDVVAGEERGVHAPERPGELFFLGVGGRAEHDEGLRTCGCAEPGLGLLEQFSQIAAEQRALLVRFTLGAADDRGAALAQVVRSPGLFSLDDD